MRFKCKVEKNGPRDIEVVFRRWWTLPFQLELLVDGIAMLKRRWWLWPGRYLREDVRSKDASLEITLIVEKWRFLPGLLPLTYRMYVRDLCVLEWYSY